MMPRTNDLMPADVTSIGASPSRAGSSNFSRTQRDEFRWLRRLHRELAVVGLAADGLGEGLFPFDRQRDQR